MQCGRIMTKLVQRNSVWTSYRASYPTLLIYDEFCKLSWMHRDLWRNLWRNWHNIMVFGLHIGLHIQHCESMTKSDSLSWMQCDLWRNLKTSCEYRHGSQGFFSVCRGKLLLKIGSFADASSKIDRSWLHRSDFCVDCLIASLIATDLAPCATLPTRSSYLVACTDPFLHWLFNCGGFWC
jgi:hypothetical protein